MKVIIGIDSAKFGTVSIFTIASNVERQTIISSDITKPVKIFGHSCYLGESIFADWNLSKGRSFMKNVIRIHTTK
jgi:hypothetical protein